MRSETKDEPALKEGPSAVSYARRVGASYWLAAASALLVGALYYLLFRGPETPFGAALSTILPHAITEGIAAVTLVDPTRGTFPSFLHTLALTWLAFALAGPRPTRRAAFTVLVLGLAVLAEVTLGTTHGADIIACLLGSGAAVLLAGPSTRPFGSAAFLRPVDGFVAERVSARVSDRRARHGAGLLVALSFAFVTGTAPYETCETSGDCFESIPSPGDNGGARVSDPVYLSYEELRRAVNVGAARPIASLGRLYVFGDRLFLNSRNEGVHVIDNSDPERPVNASFIAIPGNTELEIRGTNLYADSYVDLVTIDLGGSAYLELDRDEFVFPYDEYQNVPDDIIFVDVDRDRGVVIGHE